MCSCVCMCGVCAWGGEVVVFVYMCALGVDGMT